MEASWHRRTATNNRASSTFARVYNESTLRYSETSSKKKEKERYNDPNKTEKNSGVNDDVVVEYHNKNYTQLCYYAVTSNTLVLTYLRSYLCVNITY